MSVGDAGSIANASRQLTGTFGGGTADDLERVIATIADVIPELPPVQTIEALRSPWSLPSPSPGRE
jgi:hypothetical protein